MLLDCVKTIQSCESIFTLEIIIIDNASVKLLRAELKELLNTRLVRLSQNIGFGRACNLGARLARGEILLFLGPDVQFIEENAIARTLEKYQSLPDAGAMSCQLINQDGTPQKHCFNLPSPQRLLSEWYYELTNHLPWIYRKRKRKILPVLQKVDMVIAHWLMVSKNKFWQAGGFPEDAFMFGDDIEINYRLLKKGYQNYLYRGARAIHHGGSSTRSKYGKHLIYVVQDSITKFCIRNYGPIIGTLSIFIIILRSFLNILIISPFYIGRGFSRYLQEQIDILWHYSVYQWRREKIVQFHGHAYEY